MVRWPTPRNRLGSFLALLALLSAACGPSPTPPPATSTASPPATTGPSAPTPLASGGVGPSAAPPASAGPAGAAGAFVYVAAAKKDPTKSVLVIVGANGKEIRRLSLPDKLPELFETNMRATVVLHGTSGWYIVRTDTAAVMSVAIRPDVAPAPIPLVQGDRWWVIGSPTGGPDWLVDLASGVTTELTALPGLTHVYEPRLAPDGSFVLAYGDAWWRIPTATPTAAVKLTADLTNASVDVAPDGSRIAYIRLAPDGTGSVVTVAPDGGDPQVAVADAGPLVSVHYGRDARQLILVGTTGVSLLGPNQPAPTVVVPVPGGATVLPLLLAGDRQSAAVGIRPATGPTAWWRIDLTSGTAAPAGALSGFVALPTAEVGRWALFSSSQAIGSAARYASLDLASGSVAPVTGIPAGEDFMIAYGEVVGDGRHQLISTVSSGRQTDWIVDASSGAAAKVEGGSALGGSISPDGRRLLATLRNGTTTAVHLVDLASGKSTTVGPGLGDAWLKP